MAKAWGIKGRNPGQHDAIKHLTDPSIDLVVLSGIAGSGKTLLALAAGLEQVLESKTYNEIVFTRAPVGVGDDMGFLPGTEEEKMGPWCGALIDNLEALIGNEKLTETVLKTKIKIRAMQFMRGRSFNRKYVIIDEVQNITTAQLKVLITRAGEGCKIVCLGDAEQVDNKKLNNNNNALSTLVQLAQGVEFIKVVELPDCERSQLAKWAAEVL